MRNKFYVLLLLWISQMSIAQIEEDIIQKYREAVGGKQKWDSIHSVVIEKEFTFYMKMQGLEKGGSTHYQKYPNLFRYDKKQGAIYGYEYSERFNGKTLETRFSTGKTKIKAYQFKRSLPLVGQDLMYHKENDFFYEGIKQNDSLDYYVLTRNFGISSKEYYINPQTFLLDILIEKFYTKDMPDDVFPKNSYEGKVYAVTTYYEDYREVKGIKTPFLSKILLQGDDNFSTHEVTKLEINIPLEDSIFEFEEK